MQFTGDDLFAEKDVCSIALELPNSALGIHPVGLWARTLGKAGEGWIQADRGGRPLQAVFLPGEVRAFYLSGEPVDDDRFVGIFAHELEHAGVSLERCSQTFFTLTLAAQRRFRTTGGLSQTMSSMRSFRYLRTEK